MANIYDIRGSNSIDERTVRLLASNPPSVGVVTSKVTADSMVDGAVVEQSTVESVRYRAALRRNGRSVVTFVETTLGLYFNPPR